MSLPYGGLCPHCGSDLSYADGQYTRLEGVEVRGGYDGVSYWRCPDCETVWDRFTEEIISSPFSR